MMTYLARYSIAKVNQIQPLRLQQAIPRLDLTLLPARRIQQRVSSPTWTARTARLRDA
jgi:hypothetical protein